MRRPAVGIAAGVRVEDGERLVAMCTRYSDAVYRAGGVPVALPAGFPLDGGSSLGDGSLPGGGSSAGGGAGLDDLLGAMDALVFTGGPDFHTEPLGLGPTHPAARPGLAEKQSFDVALARRALELDIPVLGICYGMQLLGVVTGARLLQHLPDDRPDARVRHFAGAGVPDGSGGPGRPGPSGVGSGGPGIVRHDVSVVPGTRTGKALGGVSRLPVVSAHHQALAEAGPGWLVPARDDDGLVEAIESPERRFAVGVQWHPEREEPGTAHAGLFQALVEAARPR